MVILRWIVACSRWLISYNFDKLIKEYDAADKIIELNFIYFINRTVLFIFRCALKNVENFHWKFVWHLKVIRNKVVSSVDTINISTFQYKNEWTILSLNADICVDFLRKYIFQFQMHSILYDSIRQEDCKINLIGNYLFMEWIFTDMDRCRNTRWKTQEILSTYFNQWQNRNYQLFSSS